ncbi:UNVERIFIED_CONTAM: hypothetical protein FKN15_043643 [Acipenser sinensis]
MSWTGRAEVVDLVSSDTEELARKCALSYKTLVAVKRVLLAQYTAFPTNGADLYEELLSSTAILSTGNPSLDKLLDSGLYTGEVTELIGAPGSGKTQMEALRRIQVRQVFSVFSLIEALQDLRSSGFHQVAGGSGSVKVVIVDSVAAVLSPIIGGRQTEGLSLMMQLAGELRTMARDLGVAVLVTNHMTRDGNGAVKAGLGRSWSHVPRTRVLLQRVEREGAKPSGLRTATLVKSSRQPSQISQEFDLGACNQPQDLLPAPRDLDKLLDSGLYTGEVTELIGAPGSGKTQVCLGVAVSVACVLKRTVLYIDSTGGLSASRLLQMVQSKACKMEEHVCLGVAVSVACDLKRNVLYIDSTGGLSASRLLQMMEALRRIQVRQVFSVFSLIEALQDLRSSGFHQVAGGSGSVKVVIVDSVTAVLSPIMGGRQTEGLSLMMQLAAELRTMARDLGVAVLVSDYQVFPDIRKYRNIYQHEEAIWPNYACLLPISPNAPGLVRNLLLSVVSFVVDSVTAVLSPIMGGRQTEGLSLMMQLAAELRTMARDLGVAVLVTNHMTRDGNGVVKAGLGRSWSHVPRTRVLLQRVEREGAKPSGLRTATLVKSSRQALKLNPPVRRDNFCSNPGVPFGGSRSGDFFEEGSVVKYTCDSKLVLRGSSERKCLLTGVWSGEEPQCQSWYTFDNVEDLTKEIQMVRSQIFKSEQKTNERELNPLSGRTHHILFLLDSSVTVGWYNFQQGLEFIDSTIDVIWTHKVSIQVICYDNFKAEKIDVMENPMTGRPDLLADSIDYSGFSQHYGTNIYRALDAVLKSVQRAQANRVKWTIFLIAKQSSSGPSPSKMMQEIVKHIPEPDIYLGLGSVDRVQLESIIPQKSVEEWGRQYTFYLPSYDTLRLVYSESKWDGMITKDVSSAKTIGVKQIILHPQYNKDYDYDMALLELAQEISYSDTVRYDLHRWRDTR